MQTWNIMADKYAGHYVVCRDGRIYQCVPEEFWTQHIGPSKKFNDANKTSIAIFLTNELYLEKENGKYYAFGFNKPYNMYTGKVFQTHFKGYDYWADYDKPQIASLISLLKDVCYRNEMDLSMYKHTTRFHPQAPERCSIVSCANLNKDSRSLPLPDWVTEEISAGGIALIE
jgi:N-acetyl-anhydromuramyl-L-alanine amidase AmpD